MELTASKKRIFDVSTSIKWFFTLLVPIILYAAFDTIDPKIRIYLTVSSFAILIMAFDLFSSTMVAMAVPVVYVITGVAKVQDAFSAYSSPVIWITISGIIIAYMLSSTGLARRLAFLIILKVGKSFTSILVGITIAGFVLNPFIPSIMGKVSIVLPIVFGICEVMDYKKGSREGAALVIIALIGTITHRFGTLIDAGVLLPMSMMEKATGITVGFMDFIIQNMLVTTIWAFLQVAIVVLFLRPNQKIDHDLILENYKKMGVMSFNEKKALFILGVIILALATESIHKIAIQYIFVIVALICFVPGVRLLKEDDISKMNFKIMFFIAGCMAIGTVASTSGAGQWLYKIFDTFMRGSQLYTFVAAWLFGLAANFLMTPLAAESAFTGSIALMAQSAGYNPIPVVYSFMWGMDQYVLPYEVSALTYIFAFGYITYKQLVLVFIPRMVIGLLYLVTICYPFWNFIIK